jgi:hypothetical protein
MTDLLLFSHLNTLLFWMTADQAEVISAIATVVATGIALYTVIQANNTIDSVAQQTKAGTIIACVNAYIDIRKLKDAAITERDLTVAIIKAQSYYRAFCDELWVEYRLWKKEVVEDEEMWEWAEMRQIMYPKDNVTNVDGKLLTEYSTEWGRLIAENYFVSGTFLNFVNAIHGIGPTPKISNVDDLKKWKKDTKNK